MEGADRTGLVVLYGSQSGSAAEVAERIGRQARARHWRRVRVLPMDAYDRAQLVHERLAVFVASTTGQGEAPDNMRAFWSFLRRKQLPADALSGLDVAVFGLGDSSYPIYNAVARRLLVRLRELGASALHPIGLGDDQHPYGYETELEPWLSGFWAAAALKYPLPNGVAMISPELLPPAFYNIQLIDTPAATAAATPPPSKLLPASDALLASPFAPAASGSGAGIGSGAELASYTSGSVVYTPFRATVRANQRLTSADHTQDVRHVELDIRGSGLTYQPGDVLLLHAHNPLHTTAAFIRDVLGLDPLQRIAITRASAAATAPAPAAKPRAGSDAAMTPALASSAAVAMDGVVSGAGDLKAASAASAAGTALDDTDVWRLGNGGDEWLLLGPGTSARDGTAGARPQDRVRTLTLLELFAVHLDAFGTPRNSSHFFASLALFASAAIAAAAAAAANGAAATPAASSPALSAVMQRDRLKEMASAEFADERYRYCVRERRTCAEILSEFPLARPPANAGAPPALPLLCYLLEIIPRLTPRQYSISSSPLAHTDGSQPSPSEVHVCAALVEYTTPFKRWKRGIASEFLRSLSAPPTDATATAASAAPAVAATASAASDAKQSAALATTSSAAGAASAKGPPPPAPVPLRAHYVPVWVKRGSVRLPVGPSALPAPASAALATSNTPSSPPSLPPPVLMVGPGTGIAPFRSMVWQRHAMRAIATSAAAPPTAAASTAAAATAKPSPSVDAKALNTGPGALHLFCGNRYRARDYLYGDEFAALALAGSVTSLHTAFSRDPAPPGSGVSSSAVRYYVQDELKRCAALVWDVLHTHSGVFLLAGNSKQMPRDVAGAVEAVAMQCGGLSAEQAKAWLKQLIAANRYVVETWA